MSKQMPELYEPTPEEDAKILAAIERDPDTYEADDEFFRNAKRISEIDPEFYASWLKSREPFINAAGKFDMDRWSRSIFEQDLKDGDAEGAINSAMTAGADMSQFEDMVAHLELDVRLLLPKSYEWWMGARARKGKANGAVRVEIDLDVAYIFQREGEGWEKRLNDTLRKAILDD